MILTNKEALSIFIILAIFISNILVLIIAKIIFCVINKNYNNLIDNLTFTGKQLENKLLNLFNFKKDWKARFIIKHKLPKFKKYRYNNSVLANALAINLISHMSLLKAKTFEYFIILVVFSRYFSRLVWLLFYLSVFIFIFHYKHIYLYIVLTILLLIIILSVIILIFSFDKQYADIEEIVHLKFAYTKEEIKKISKISKIINFIILSSIIYESSFITFYIYKLLRWFYLKILYKY